MSDKKDILDRLYASRSEGCWRAVMDYIDAELESLRTRLESVRGDAVQKMQGRVSQLRQMQKAMLGQEQRESSPD
uniref:Uncharacterized protein n=1 Tax=Desulfovibrio sp. U5L TaxID=596152 RepID=I2Q1E4_9BACT